MSKRDHWVTVAAGFLAVSYGLGAPLAAFLEYRGHTLSQRFGYPPELIYCVSAIQCLCAGGVLVRRLAPWVAGGLTVTTLGAIVSHLRIGSPLTALPAVFYTAVQVWFGLRRR
jgi:DoxX-like family